MKPLNFVYWQLLQFVYLFVNVTHFLYLFSPLDHVKSVSMTTLVVETLTIAAYVFPVAAGREASTIFLASVKDRLFSTFTCSTVFSIFHLEQSREYAKCFPSQLVHAS